MDHQYRRQEVADSDALQYAPPGNLGDSRKVIGQWAGHEHAHKKHHNGAPGDVEVELLCALPLLLVSLQGNRNDRADDEQKQWPDQIIESESLVPLWMAKLVIKQRRD